MNIIGHGIDLVDIAEVRRRIGDPGDSFVERCFIQEELDEVGGGPDRIEQLAGRFAAKEAVLKALGSGFGGSVALTDVVIKGVAGAAPQVRLRGGATKAAVRRGVTEWLVSISHAGAIATASAIAIDSVSRSGIRERY